MRADAWRSVCESAASGIRKAATDYGLQTEELVEIDDKLAEYTKEGWPIGPSLKPSISTRR